jgi:glycosyltransferase involved in cell wall biosynthesis
MLSKSSTVRQTLGPRRKVLCMNLSVVVITHNEEANIGRTLASVQPLIVDGKGEIIVVDSGSIDGTVEIAKSFGAQVFVEAWKGYAAQKNSAIDKAAGDWILSLDADEEISAGLAIEIQVILELPGRGSTSVPLGFRIPRKNLFLGRWMKHGGFWPDPKLRLFHKESARFEQRLVHEDAHLGTGVAGDLKQPLLHHAYPTLADYIDHMNRYSSLGAEMAVAKDQFGFSIFNIVFRPFATFIYNYLFRLGFVDGREGLLLHLYHAGYVSWKYAKAWELTRSKVPSKR